MFGSKKDKVSEDEIARLNGEIERLRKREHELKSSVDNLALEKKISEEDIKHMTRMKEEKLALEHDKNLVEMEREKAEEIAKVKDEYREKLEGELTRQIAEGKEMYAKLMEYLPKIGVKLSGNVNG